MYRCHLQEDILSPSECQNMIVHLEQVGFAKMAGLYPDGYRNNDRVVLDDPELAHKLFLRLLPILPSGALGLNPRFRGCRYQAGQSFAIHRDGPWVTETEESRVTVMFYLSDGADFVGGDTVFYTSREGTEELRVRPKQGAVLVFDHQHWHTGEPVTQGVKYVFRTDVMFSRAQKQGYVWSLAAGPGGVAIGTREGRVQLGQTSWMGPGGSVGAVAWWGSRLVGGQRNGTLWVAGGNTWRGHAGAILGLCSHQNQLFSVGADGWVRAWAWPDTQVGALSVGGWVRGVGTLQEGVLVGGRGQLIGCSRSLLPCWEQSFGVSCVGAAGWVGGENGELMQVSSLGERLKLWTGHRGRVLGVAAWGDRLISGGEDGWVRIWRGDNLIYELDTGDFVTCVGWMGDRPVWGGYAGMDVGDENQGWGLGSYDAVGAASAGTGAGDSVL